jgi:acyl-CoA synthetase (AMP-forming)/AMP-acid ligase II
VLDLAGVLELVIHTLNERPFAQQQPAGGGQQPFTHVLALFDYELNTVLDQPLLGQTPSDEQARELQAHVKATLTPVKYPRWVEFTHELPKTATGKIQRYRLREALAGEPHPNAGDAEMAAGE